MLSKGGGKLTETLAVQSDHPGPVAGVGAAPDTAGNLVEIDQVARGKTSVAQAASDSLLLNTPGQSGDVDSRPGGPHSELLVLQAQSSEILSAPVLPRERSDLTVESCQAV